jgi:hypothetical protein
MICDEVDDDLGVTFGFSLHFTMICDERGDDFVMILRQKSGFYP